MKLFTCFAPITALLAAGCTGYIPILDGPESAAYQSDLHDCQTLAESQERFRQEALGAAVAGGLLGGGYAQHDGGATAIEGIIGGALIAYALARIEAAEEQEDIVVACMQGRGHRVVG